MKIQEAIDKTKHHIAHAKMVDDTYVEDSTITVDSLQILLDEITRCHKLIDALENCGVRSKSVVKRIHAQVFTKDSEAGQHPELEEG